MERVYIAPGLFDRNVRKLHSGHFGLRRSIPAAAAEGGETGFDQRVEWSAAGRAGPREQGRDAELARRLELRKDRASLARE